MKQAVQVPPRGGAGLGFGESRPSSGGERALGGGFTPQSFLVVLCWGLLETPTGVGGILPPSTHSSGEAVNGVGTTAAGVLVSHLPKF